MRKLDYFWRSNENWYHLNGNGVFVLNDDAPEEAKESYENYLRQKGIDPEKKKLKWSRNFNERGWSYGKYVYHNHRR